jgi:hypothetical protein
MSPPDSIGAKNNTIRIPLTISKINMAMLACAMSRG